MALAGVVQAQQKQLAIELEKPETYASGSRATDLNRQLLRVQSQLEARQAEWEKALEELEALRTENAYLKKLKALVQAQAKSTPNSERKS